ncbi:MAG TPA: hypothetical protein VLE43_01690, partial [Candidatus Saccharimonadia bacterium]|nr:hypothetical protein [Candidatus Saccharimonadia bacterium]
VGGGGAELRREIALRRCSPTASAPIFGRAGAHPYRSFWCEERNTGGVQNYAAAFTTLSYQPTLLHANELGIIVRALSNTPRRKTQARHGAWTA